VRNGVRFGSPVPIERGVIGPVLWYASLGYVRTPGDSGAQEPYRSLMARLPATEWDRPLLAEAARNIARRPLRYIATSGARLWALWTDSYACYLLHDHPALRAGMERHWDACEWTGRAFFAALCLLALARLARAREPATLGLAAVAACFNAYAFFAVFARYLTPAVPLLCLLAGMTAADWAASPRGTSQGTSH
jgi:hypothetical protein